MTEEESIARGYMVRLPNGDLRPNRDNLEVQAAIADINRRMTEDIRSRAEAHLGVPVRLNVCQDRWEKKAPCGHWAPITKEDMS